VTGLKCRVYRRGSGESPAIVARWEYGDRVFERSWSPVQEASFAGGVDRFYYQQAISVNRAFNEIGVHIAVGRFYDALREAVTV
jgi:hypothetical protein